MYTNIIRIVDMYNKSVTPLYSLMVFNILLLISSLHPFDECSSSDNCLRLFRGCDQSMTSESR